MNTTETKEALTHLKHAYQYICDTREIWDFGESWDLNNPNDQTLSILTACEALVRLASN